MKWKAHRRKKLISSRDQLSPSRESVVTVTDVLTAYLMQRLLINNLRYNIVTYTVSQSGLVSLLVMFYTLTDFFGEMSQTY